MVLCTAAALLGQAEVKGVVRDAQTGEPLSRVAVQLAEPSRQVITGAAGTFDLGGLADGEYDLKVSTVGYRLLQTHLTVESGEAKELSLALSPDTFRRTEHIEVRTDPFDAALDFTIGGNEIKNLSTVLADDPLRAVQSMPGVSSNDDFESRFSLHGAPYEQIGLYLDDILLHMPFHTVQGEGPSGSMTVFNGDMVDSMSLQSEAYDARFEDRTAGVLDVHTRDGSRSETSFRLTAGVADAGILAEGPLGKKHRGSWLASFRKSYLQYLLQQSADQPMAFGFMDSQVQFTYDLTPRNNVKLKLVDGTSDLDSSKLRDSLPLNTSMLAGYRFTLINLEWQYSPSPEFLLTSHAAFMRERYADTNVNQNTLGEGFYGEWVGKSDATWIWDPSATLGFGVSARRIRGQGSSEYYSDATAATLTDGYRGNLTLLGGYAQQSWSGLRKRLHLSAGVRWERMAGNGPATLSPQGSVAFLPNPSTKFQVSWGRYSQFPDVQDLDSIYVTTRLLPARSTHTVAAVEQRLGRLARLRVEAYQRVDRDLPFRPYEEARLAAGGQIIPDNFQAPITNSLSGRAKGVEIFLQKRTANRLTGWVSYSLGYSRQQDSVTGARFASDQDQRHTVNAYLGYRIRPSVNLSLKWTYGSGFPVPGYFQLEGGAYYLSSVLNGARLAPYQRTDVRINKSRTFDRWKITVYGEVVNLLNRPNYRFDSYNGYNPATGQAYLSFMNMFPILPSAGVMVEF
jgi:hypothetical protein